MSNFKYCPYCGDSECFEETLNSEGHTSIAICNYFGKINVVAYGDEAVGFKPKYCLMCGREIVNLRKESGEEP